MGAVGSRGQRAEATDDVPLLDTELEKGMHHRASATSGASLGSATRSNSGMDADDSDDSDDADNAPDDDIDLTWSRSGGCCGVTTGLKVFFGKRGWGWHWFRMRVFLTILGSLFFWVGTWNLWQYDCALSTNLALRSRGCTVEFHEHDGNVTGEKDADNMGNNPVRMVRRWWEAESATVESSSTTAVPTESNDDYWYAEEAGMKVGPEFRGMVTMSAGFVLLIASDTLLSNAGLEGALFPSWHTNEIKKNWAGKVFHTGPRLVIALLGTTALWSGQYAAMQNTFGRDWTFCSNDNDFASGSRTNAAKQCAPDFIIHVIVFALGLLCLGATGTYSSITFLYPEGVNAEANLLQRLLRMENVEDHGQMTNMDRVRYSIRAFFCILGQNLLWFSSTRALDYSKPYHGDRLERPFFYTFLGLWLMHISDSLIGFSWLEEDEEDEDEDEDEAAEDEEGADDSRNIDGDSDRLSHDDNPGVDNIGRAVSNQPSIYEDVVDLPDPVSNPESAEYNEDEPRGRARTLTLTRVRTNTGVLIESADISDESVEEPCCHADRYPVLQWQIQSFVALLGQLTWYYGAWTVVDVFMVGTATVGIQPGVMTQFRTTELNIMMVVVGLLICGFTGNIMTNASMGLMPVYDPKSS